MIQKIAAQIRSLIGRRRPETAIILGSGLGALADEITDSVSISYADIDGFPQSTVQGHGGKLIIGRLENKEILCMQGRFHLYEGHKPQVINTVIKAFQLLGIKNLIVTNAAGSLNPEFAPGSLMLIKDHINFSGTNPLIGPNDDRYGPRFPGMTDAYTAEWRHKSKNWLPNGIFRSTKASICGRSAPALKPRPKSKCFGFSAATPSVCPPCPKLSAPPTPA